MRQTGAGTIVIHVERFRISDESIRVNLKSSLSRSHVLIHNLKYMKVLNFHLLHSRTSGCDHLSSATSFSKIPKFPSQSTIFGTSYKRPPLLSDQLSKIPKFRSQITIFGTSYKRPPLLSDLFFQNSKISKSNHYIWNLL